METKEKSAKTGQTRHFRGGSLEGFSALRSSQWVPKMVPAITWSIVGVEAKEKYGLGQIG